MNLKNIGKRLLQMVIVLIGISFLTFFLTHLAPGDPAAAMYEAAGITPTQEQLATARAQMNLDQPLVIQYTSWLTGCLNGDFGTSFSKHNAVLSLLSERLIPTLKLAIFSIILMLIFAIPLGILSAVKQDKWIDYFIRVINFMGISMPGFWVGLMLLYFVGLKLNWLPVISNDTGITKLIMPGITLAVAMTSKYTRQVRTAILEELSMDYVIGARARGAGWGRILWNHVLPNAMLPLITMLGLSFGSLLGGTTVVELIFGYPGLGQLSVTAVLARDYPLIQGVVLWIALIYMVINLIVDISYSILDPRIREAR